MSCGSTHLQMSDGLPVPLNDEEFAAEAPEVHVVDHAGPLAGYLVHRLTPMETDKQNMLPTRLPQDPAKDAPHVSGIKAELTSMTSCCFLGS